MRRNYNEEYIGKKKDAFGQKFMLKCCVKTRDKMFGILEGFVGASTAKVSYEYPDCPVEYELVPIHHLAVVSPSHYRAHMKHHGSRFMSLRNA